MTATYERSWTHEDRKSLNDAGPGPWHDEPDKVHWIDPETGLDCLAVRNGGGAWCGYVGLPPDHPFHGVDYDDAHDRADINVHGGLTFAASCHEDERGEGYGICHIPLPGRPADVWWLGFDCAHAWDLSPGYLRYGLSLGDREVYRDLAYVKAETTDLARQLAAVAR